MTKLMLELEIQHKDRSFWISKIWTCVQVIVTLCIISEYPFFFCNKREIVLLLVSINFSFFQFQHKYETAIFCSKGYIFSCMQSSLASPWTLTNTPKVWATWNWHSHLSGAPYSFLTDCDPSATQRGPPSNYPKYICQYDNNSKDCHFPNSLNLT